MSKKTTVDGGTAVAGATGTFVGSVGGSAVARRKADGSCDQQHPPLIEIDTVTGTGGLSSEKRVAVGLHGFGRRATLGDTPCLDSTE